MSNIHIRRAHSLGSPRAKSLVDDIAAQLSQEFGVAGVWKGDTLHFERTGLNGTLRVSETEIVLDLALAWIMRPFRDRIVKAVEQRLDAILSEKSSPER